MDLCLFRQMGLRNAKNESTKVFVMDGTNEPDICNCEYFEFLRRYNINLQLTSCAINSICIDAVSSSHLDGMDRDCEAKEEFQCLNSNEGNTTTTTTTTTNGGGNTTTATTTTTTTNGDANNTTTTTTTATTTTITTTTNGGGNGGNNGSLSNFCLNAFILNIFLLMVFIFRYIQV